MLISLTTRIGEEEAMERRLQAELTHMEKDDFRAVRLSYEQILDEAGEETIPEVLTARLKGDGTIVRMSLKRPGSIFAMDFETGKISRTEITTPAGILPVTVRTKSVDGSFSGDRFTAQVLYEMWIAETCRGEVRLDVAARGSF